MSSSSPWIRDVTAASFQADVVEASKERPVVIDFWAPWCAPCRALAPLLEKLISEREGRILLAKVNTDEEEDLARYFNISALPSVKVISNGQLMNAFEGLVPEADIARFLDEIAPGSAPALMHAQEIEATAPEQAEERYRKLLVEQPANDEVRLGLARVLLVQGKADEVEEVLEPVSAQGEPGEEAERIKAKLYLLRAAQGLPDESTLRQRIAATPEDAQARLELGCVLAVKEAWPEALEMLWSALERDRKLATGRGKEIMVKMFYALGSNHPLANEYRTRLSRLLY
jgi:putative thioredoxin